MTIMWGGEDGGKVKQHTAPRGEHTPSSTAVTIVAKLSSRRMMLAACLETSVPVMPMAMPDGMKLKCREEWEGDKG